MLRDKTQFSAEAAELDCAANMSAPTTTNSVSSSPKRSWRRFTLRALLFFVLAAGIFFGWVAYRIRVLQSRYEWITALQAEDGNGPTLKPMEYEWFWRPLVGNAAVTVKRAVLNSYSVEQRMYLLTPSDLHQVTECTAVEDLLLAGPAITDETIQFVRRFRDLRTLGLENTGITDAGMNCIADLSKLETIAVITNPDRPAVLGAGLTEKSLKDLVRGKDLKVLALTAPISDESLRIIITNCPNLHTLQLLGSRITKEGLAAIRHLPQLRDLTLSHNRAIDDNAILELIGSPALKRLWLQSTNVSESGARELVHNMSGTRVRIENGRHSRDY